MKTMRKSTLRRQADWQPFMKMVCEHHERQLENTGDGGKDIPLYEGKAVHKYCQLPARCNGHSIYTGIFLLMILNWAYKPLCRVKH